MTPEQRRREWNASLMPGQFRQLFDHLPGTLFFAKDQDGRLMAGNPAFVKRCGFYDHSDFARQFRRQMGQTASQYRAEHRAKGRVPAF